MEKEWKIKGRERKEMFVGAVDLSYRHGSPVITLKAKEKKIFKVLKFSRYALSLVRRRVRSPKPDFPGGAGVGISILCSPNTLDKTSVSRT